MPSQSSMQRKRDAEHLRICFFSDWRIQPLWLAENLISSVTPLDLIVYGGDDIARLAKAPDGNWLSRISSYARYGVVVVMGNDDRPADRALLNVPGVRNIHASPTVIAGWGFVGIEGSIYSGEKNKIGFVLHADGKKIERHLRSALKTLDIPSDRLVIVSHTPPAGCRLDYAQRFGFDQLGSKTLQNFVIKNSPALVLSGHCHFRGGKHAYLGQTLVVNGASDDTRIQGTRASLIELTPDEPPRIVWLDPLADSVMSIPDIGVRRAEILRSFGITSLKQLFAAPIEALKAIRFAGPIRTPRLQAYAHAMTENTSVWLRKPSIPDKLLFYDVETGLSTPGLFGPTQEPWMIAISDGGETEQWVVPDENHEARRRMYEEFLEYIRAHPGYTLCSYSGLNFDERAVMEGLRRWHETAVDEWLALSKLDLLREFKQSLVLPTRSWKLKEVAEWCGYVFDTLDLDGLEVGLLYECYRQLGEPLPVERIARYNAEDARALAFIVQWAREHSPTLATPECY
ncbi:MAG: ribonuclease H-like domain-containing protein [Anaerolineae bacterium]|nr:ribonuclease H-like domain-containing protein [Anaerolineae bacterium]